jgi:hypothetical protein
LGGANTNLPARRRAEDACRNQRALIIIEGAEEADGRESRARLTELLGVLDPVNRYLILTRDSSQVVPAIAVQLKEALDDTAAGDLFDQITGTSMPPGVRDDVLRLLGGHPLALTWAANLLARGDESPRQLRDEWNKASLPNLSDPTEARHTLKWLFERSVRGLNDVERLALEAAGLLAHAEFPLTAMAAGLGEPENPRPALQRLVQSGLLRLSVTREDHWHFTHVLGYQFARRESGSDPQLRQRLAQWLEADLAKLMGPGDHAALLKVLLHIASLLRADDDHSLWSLVKCCLYDGVDRMMALGQLDLVVQLLRSVTGWFDKLPPQKRAETTWQRERSVIYNRLGSVQQAQGDLAGAQRSYSNGRDIALKLAQSDPTNSQWQRDLSIS